MAFLGTRASGQAIRNYTIEISCKPRYYNSSYTILDFKWKKRTPSASSQNVYRKTKTAITWGSVYRSIGASDSTFSDTILIGSQYEYSLEKNSGPYAFTYPVYGFITSGHKVPAVTNRGKIMLIIDSTHKTYLDSSIRTLRNDLIGDGWQPLVKYFSPSTTVTQIKAYILKTYKADPTNVKSLLLIGDLAVPYSGDFYEYGPEYPPDGHTSVNSPGASHEGAWPADCYYGDVLTDSLWTDNTVVNDSGSRVANKNAIGDGKFDNSIIPYLITLQVGRLDLSNMSNFSLSERDLLKQYLKRNHDYRHKVFSVKERCLLDDVFGTALVPEGFANNAYRNMAPLINDSCVKARDYLKTLDTADYMWSFGFGYGGYNYNSAIGYTTDIANSSQEIKSVFNGFFGSYFIDWDNANNFLRAPLAAKGYALNTFAVGRPNWFFHHMGMGDPIGFSAMMTQNNFDNVASSLLYPSFGYSYWNIHPALMGDPTVRMQMVEPAKNLIVNQDSCSHRFKLKWTASGDTAVHNYYIFRAKDIDSTFSLLGSTTNLSYIDANPLTGNNVYMVRDLKLQISGSGTYYNLGQGIFANVNTNNYFKPTVNAGRDSVLCGNQPIKIGIHYNNLNTVYAWTPSVNYKDTATILAKYTSNYVLSATDTISKCLVKDTMHLTVIGPVAETITQSLQNACKDSTSFSSTSHNGNGFNYQWIFPSGNPNTVSGHAYINPGMVTYSATGSFMNTLTITDTTNGCFHVDSSQVIVSCLQALPIHEFLFSCESNVKDLYQIHFQTFTSNEVKYYLIEGLNKSSDWELISKLSGDEIHNLEIDIEKHRFSEVRLRSKAFNNIFNELDNCYAPSQNVQYSIYPNPALTELNVDFSGNRLANLDFSIFNAFGQKIQLPIMHQNSQIIQFDLSNLAMGNYILLIQNNSTIYTYKFVKQ